MSDGPKNTVTFGAKAGSLAPWLVQSVLADVSREIATGVWDAVPSTQLKGQPESGLARGSRPASADQVLLDGFAPAGDSSTLRAYDCLVRALVRVVDATQDLARALAPVAAEAEVYRRWFESVEKAWEKAVADAKDDPDAAGDFEKALVELGKRLLARQNAASPCRPSHRIDRVGLVATAGASATPGHDRWTHP